MILFIILFIMKMKNEQFSIDGSHSLVLYSFSVMLTCCSDPSVSAGNFDMAKIR
jgi:hypothetical protein